MNLPLSLPVLLLQLAQTCDYAPAQWEGMTTSNCPVYIKGRHGVLSVRLGPPGGSISDAVRGHEIARILFEEADVLSTEDMLRELVAILDSSMVQNFGRFEQRIDG